MQEDRDNADISEIIRKLHEVIEPAIEVRSDTVSEPQKPFDISRVDFERLHRVFERSKAKRTTVQSLKDAIEKRLHRLLECNPLRTDFQRRYEEIVAEYNREKDRMTIEKTFEDLLRFMQGIGRRRHGISAKGLTRRRSPSFGDGSGDQVRKRVPPCLLGLS